MANADQFKDMTCNIKIGKKRPATTLVISESTIGEPDKR
jgi:hypothetical protein